MLRCHGPVRPVLVAMLMAVPLAGAGATLTARAAGAASVPGAPQAVSAVQHGSTAAQLTWQFPASNGGAEITGFVVTPYKAGVAQPAVTFHSRMPHQILTGLKIKVSYRFTVAAKNAAGTGAPSAKTVAIVIGAPGIPTIHTVKVVSRHRLQVFVDTGPYGIAGNGSPVNGLHATCTSSNGGVKGTGNGKDNPGNDWNWVYTSSLTAGKSYTCTVTGTNARGTSLPSPPSSAITVK